MAQFTDVDWVSLGSIPGANGPVHAVLLDEDGGMTVGGGFTVIGGVRTGGLARWNGSAWSAVGGGVNGEVRCLARDAAGGLFVGGAFTQAGGQSVSNIAFWNGTEWSNLGGGVEGTVFALLSQAPGRVVAGGEITVAGGLGVGRLARWNSTSWEEVGDGVSDTVYALAPNGGAGFFVGGAFVEAGTQTVRRVAEWTGTQWQSLGQGLDETVFALHRTESGDLIVGGEFSQSGAVNCPYLARWNGSAWSGFGDGPNSVVLAITSSGTQLYMTGSFTQAGSGPVRNATAFDGSVWTDLAGGVSGSGHAIAVRGGKVAIGGSFSEAGNVAALSIALLEGGQWQAAGTGINAAVQAVHADATGVYAGGLFTRLGGQELRYVARWDGTQWLSLGSGLNGQVLALAADGAGNVYAGGTFTQAGGNAALRVAKWNGSSWSALSSGLAGTVRALVWHDGSLYAGGDFTTSGAGAIVNHVARWNGSSWVALGSGVNQPVLALAGHEGSLYAGGSFSQAGGGAAAAVARWNGSSWSALGSGCNAQVTALAMNEDGTLFAGGFFTTAGGSGASAVASWNGSAWSSLGAGCNGAVRALAVDLSGRLFAGGSFSSAGGSAAARIAQWNGQTWSPLGSGLDNTVRALSFDGDGSIYVGGEFSAAGGKVTGFAARALVAPSTGPDLWVEQPVNTPLLSGQTTVNFGERLLGNQAPLTFTLRNRGSTPLTGLVMTFADTGQPEDFQINLVGVPSTLQAGQSAVFTVTFDPSGAGSRSAVLRIASNDTDPQPFLVLLEGVGLNSDNAFFIKQPVSQLVRLGQPAALTAQVGGLGPPTQQWFKGGVRINGATSTTLTIPKARMADARPYHLRINNALNTANSRLVYVGVFTPPPAVVAVREGGTLTLTCPVTLPAGVSLEWAWEREGDALVNDARLAGATTKTLRLTGIQTAEAGEYVCLMTLRTPNEVVSASVSVQVGVEAVPVLNPLTLPDTLVNEPVNRLVTIANAPGRLSATGLPPGVVLNPVTGELTGRPLRARLVKGLPAPYTVTFRASNLAGSGPPLVVNWTILPLPTLATGEFNGLVDRNAALNGPAADSEEGLGGLLRVVTTAAAGLSGSLRQGKTTSTFKGLLDPSVGGGTLYTGSWSIVRKGLPALTLALELDTTTGALTGTVTDGSATAALEAWRATPGGAATGTWNVALLPDAALAGEPGYPEGEGHAILKIDAKGKAVWSGRLSEGTAITGATTLGPAGQVPFFVAPYALTGSVMGWVEILGDELDGSLSWWKAPQAASVKTASYKSGIPLHVLEAVGGPYAQPDPGLTVLGWAQAQIAFSLAGLAAPLEREFAVTSSNQALVDPGNDTVTLSLNARTGLLTCGFVLAAEPTRRATGFALIVPRLDRAAGAFNWPASSVSGAPVISGRVSAAAVP